MNLESADGRQKPSQRHERRFLHSATLLLALTAVSKAFSALGSSTILEKADPVFWMLKNRELLLLTSLAEIVVAFLLISRVSLSVKRGSLLWLCANFLLYRAGLWMTGTPTTCKCMGDLADRLGLSDSQASWIMLGVLTYLLGGCLTFLWRARSSQGPFDELPSQPRKCPAEAPRIEAH